MGPINCAPNPCAIALMKIRYVHISKYVRHIANCLGPALRCDSGTYSK